jgi:hypothetical protein
VKEQPGRVRKVNLTAPYTSTVLDPFFLHSFGPSKLNFEYEVSVFRVFMRLYKYLHSVTLVLQLGFTILCHRSRTSTCHKSFNLVLFHFLLYPVKFSAHDSRSRFQFPNSQFSLCFEFASLHL